MCPEPHYPGGKLDDSRAVPGRMAQADGVRLSAGGRGSGGAVREGAVAHRGPEPGRCRAAGGRPGLLLQRPGRARRLPPTPARHLAGKSCSTAQSFLETPAQCWDGLQLCASFRRRTPQVAQGRCVQCPCKQHYYSASCGAVKRGGSRQTRRALPVEGTKIWRGA